MHGTYRGYDIYSMGPPSSGGVTLVSMLNILEGYDLTGMGHNSALYPSCTHRSDAADLCGIGPVF